MRPIWKPSNLLGQVGLLALGMNTAQAVQIDINSPDSVKSAAKTVAGGMMGWYTGYQPGQTVGLLPLPYYWWEAGALFGLAVEYWYYTGDTQYNDQVTQGLLAQVGPNNDFMPPNQTKTEGNDDQVFWAFAALSAAELGFPNPPSNQPQWLALAQAVFNLQANRWDTSSCGGGLRWQIFPFNAGYDYKNTISNGGFFQLAARLARYTGNTTYADWANKMYDWFESTPLLTSEFVINDGSATAKNCSDASQLQWTYNYGTFLSGAAYMYNYTNGDQKWLHRVEGILNGTNVFFPAENNGVMEEVACETGQTCDNDQPSFKAYLSRWMAVTSQLVPSTASIIMPKLQASAKGAAQQCSGGDSGTTCGRRWYQSTYDGQKGPGEEMSALSIIQANLIQHVPPPVTGNSGGTSKGDPTAGSGGDNPSTVNPELASKITIGDRVGAGILTTLVLALLVGTCWWMI
ncbi:MAG: hydrolase 76 protein [Vezdaea acicularis]|nr:MAG: hydrolase 76 protein [Vezdaea acicularis]